MVSNFIFFFLNKMIYVDYDTLEAQSFTPNLVLLLFGLVTVCCHVVFHLWIERPYRAEELP